MCPWEPRDLPPKPRAPWETPQNPPSLLLRNPSSVLFKFPAQARRIVCGKSRVGETEAPTDPVRRVNRRPCFAQSGAGALGIFEDCGREVAEGSQGATGALVGQDLPPRSSRWTAPRPPLGVDTSRGESLRGRREPKGRMKCPGNLEERGMPHSDIGAGPGKWPTLLEATPSRRPTQSGAPRRERTSQGRWTKASTLHLRRQREGRNDYGARHSRRCWTSDADDHSGDFLRVPGDAPPPPSHLLDV